MSFCLYSLFFTLNIVCLPPLLFLLFLNWNLRRMKYRFLHYLPMKSFLSRHGIKRRRSYLRHVLLRDKINEDRAQMLTQFEASGACCPTAEFPGKGAWWVLCGMGCLCNSCWEANAEPCFPISPVVLKAKILFGFLLGLTGTNAGLS